MPVVFDPITEASYFVAREPRPGQSVRSLMRAGAGAIPLDPPKEAEPEKQPAAAYPYSTGLVFSQRV